MLYTASNFDMYELTRRLDRMQRILIISLILKYLEGGRLLRLPSAIMPPFQFKVRSLTGSVVSKEEQTEVCYALLSLR